jgi:hypothetical protein
MYLRLRPTLSPLTLIAPRHPLPFPLNRDDAVLYEFSKNGIWEGISALGLAPGDKVVVPSYICRSALEPLYDYGLESRFFRIDERLEPDRRDLERQIGSGAKAVLFVHYFGFPQDLDYFATLRERYGVILIEDCAHALLGSREGIPLGSIGDVSIFCMRKFVPITDGAAMLLKAPPGGDAAERNPHKLKAVKGTLDLMVRHFEFRTGRRLSRIRELLRMRRLVLPERRPADANSNRINAYDLTISGPSRYLLRRFDWNSIYVRRRANYSYLLDLIADVPGLKPVFGALPDGSCPQILPVLAENRDEVLTSLQQRGIKAGCWPEDTVTDTGCEKADLMMQKMLILPVQQNLKKRHIRLCAKHVREICSPHGRDEVVTLSAAN